MSKLVPCSLIAVVSLAAAAVALGASEATTFSADQTARAEGASTGLKFNLAFADEAAPDALPSGLRTFKVKLHRGARFDGRGATQCRVTDDELTQEGVDACPPASRIGSGKATATTAAGQTVEPEAVIFNQLVGRRQAFLFLFVLNDTVAAAFDAFIKDGTISSQGLSGVLPGDFVVTKFSGTIEKHSKGRGKRRRNLITSPDVCPRGRREWVAKGTFTFQNGDKDTASSTSPCRP